MDSSRTEEASVRLDRVSEGRGTHEDLWRLYWFFKDLGVNNTGGFIIMPELQARAARFFGAHSSASAHVAMSIAEDGRGKGDRWLLVEDYDWAQAFVTAMSDVQAVYSDLEKVDIFGFEIRDIAEAIGVDAGTREGGYWLVAGRLYDGRWFALKAGCCYTGWDVIADGNVRLAASIETLAIFGLDAGERARLGIELELPGEAR